MKINIILPFFPKSPGGGVKVMYEYAKRFSKQGHDVIVYHSMQTPYTFLSDKSKLSIFNKYFRHFITGRITKGPSWYDMPLTVKYSEIPFVSNFFVRDADVCFSTWWATAFDIAKLSEQKGKKVNLIQDYEIIMTDFKDLVHDSYDLNIEHVVISEYLKQLLKDRTGKDVPLVANGVDFDKYVYRNKIEKRDPYSVIMLYANHERKGSKFGIEALDSLKKKYPQLKANLFSVDERPSWLPLWIDFSQRPNNLVDLYNNSSIFLTPSIQEGLALPPMEAMACGCACVCTNIGGHAGYAIDGETALLTESKNSKSMELAIEKLLLDNEYRIELAKKGNAHIQNFDWNISTCKMLDIFYK